MMTTRTTIAWLTLLAAAGCGDGSSAGTTVTRIVVADPGPTQLIRVPAGVFEPLFPGKNAARQVAVAAFDLAAHPGTTGQFAAFVAANPRWRRSLVSPLFADGAYLAHWQSDTDPGAVWLDRPVTAVSWFAARAYARWRGRRLPTLAEWEVAAALPLADGRDISAVVLEWYGRPGRGDPGPIGTGSATASGVRDLHGLVWEWVSDFASAFGGDDARAATDLQRTLFCGAGALGSARPEDYAAFMRYAMRSSMKGARTTRNVGFRCAADAPSGKE